MFPFFSPLPSVLVSLIFSLFCLQSLGIAISWFPATHSRKNQLLDLTIGKEEEEQQQQPAARPHGGRRTAAPCLDPSGKQEHRHSRGDAAITRLSSTAPRGSKNKQTSKPPKRRKQGSKKSKQERRKEEEDEDEDEGPSVESGDEYVRMYPEVLYSRISPNFTTPQVPAQNGSL